MKKSPSVYIVILNYNGQAVLARCLSSVFKIDYPNFQVVLVDNGSKDGSFEFVRSNFSRAHLIRNEENLGFGAGNNIGIRFALERTADYVLLLNNDTEVEPDFLEKLVAASEKDPSVGIVSPVIFDGKTRDIWFSGGKIDWMRMKMVHEKDIQKEDVYPTEIISGCSPLIKSEVFQKIGLFDEDYFLYWEDVDFSYRANKAGFKNRMIASSWVYHFEQSNKKIETKTYWLVISGLIFFKKNTPTVLKPWIYTYIWLRKAKNIIDCALKRDPLSRSVEKAYEDFKNAGF